MNKEKFSAMNATPQEYIGGAVVLAAALSARGAIREFYKNSKEQYGEIKKDFKDTDSRADKAKTVLKNWRYQRSLVAAATGARDELRKGVEIFKPKNSSPKVVSHAA